MADTIKVGGQDLSVGRLTAAHFEDFYDETVQVMQLENAWPPTKAQLTAIITLFHQALVAAGATVTREEVRALFGPADVLLVLPAVLKAMGFVRRETDVGEAKGP